MSEICKVEGCGKPKDKSQGSSMCTMHRVRWSRHKSHDLPAKPGLPDGVSKICKRHGNLTRDEVYLNGKNAQYQCRHCKKEAFIRYKEKNSNKKNTRNFIHVGGYQNRIVVHVNKYEELALKQNNLCKICKSPETMVNNKRGVVKRLAIDHCHKTNKIRGLLCHHCNVSLGGFKDSIELLKAAIEYLQENS